MSSMTSLAAQSLLRNIIDGDLEACLALVENGIINLDERDEIGQTFLMVACQKGETEIVKLLLDQPSIDVNAVDNDNWTALLNASKEGHLAIVELLLDAGAVVDHRDIGGWTSLMWTCYKGWTEVAEVLLNNHANPSVKGEHHMSCLTWASGRGYTEIVKLLLRFGAKVNTVDKYGTTPLIWAARKGHTQIVELLLLGGANVDNSGMNSWTALTMAAKGGFTGCVKAILHCSPNVNCVDKDGLTPLAHAAKEGSVEIVDLLLQKGAYVNLPDRYGDTILIHAVKGGHLEVVKSLVRKYADIDVEGIDHKTALYWSVEKGHTMVTRVLLEHNADTEIPTKDGDTALLKAVRSRNYEVTKLLVDKGAKLHTVDKKGDTALHIAVRGRSKKICEYLLRNPKDHRLLYRPNRMGETPYQIDANQEKSILTQVFGAKNLNKVENMEGYDIYSSTIADVLSVPSLHTPITLGLYAKWGSGKSFLISRLIKEMKSFTQHNDESNFQFSVLQAFISLLLAVILGLTLGFTTKWYAGLAAGAGLFLLQYILLGLLHFAAVIKEKIWAQGFSRYLARKLRFLGLFLRVLFCHQPEHPSTETAAVKFCFTDNTRLATVVGEKSIASMVATLCEALEHEYGTLAVRLFQVFKPKGSDSGRFKTLCCVPYFLLVAFVVLCIGAAAALLAIFGVHSLLESTEYTVVNSILIALGIIIGLALVGNIYTWSHCLYCLVMPAKRRVWKIASNIDSLKMEGFMQNLKKEVQLMTEMVHCMDCFLGQRCRLVVIVDCLDSCEQEKLLQVLDIVQMLFSEQDSPYITILAVDPHVIIKGIDNNLKGPFHDSSINGYDYLSNVVQLPFFLQSQALPEHNTARPERSDSTSGDTPQHKRHELASSSHLSLYEGKSRARTKDSISSSKNVFGSIILSRHTSNMDLSKTLEKSSYFSDVNPKNMRRLMNIIAVTGRLLRAHHLDFNWFKLSSWINLTEQWPYRLSWIILYIEDQWDTLEDHVPLKTVYQRVNSKIPQSKDVEALVEIDRNPRKLEIVLANQNPLLTVGDLRLFMKCTINVDPYLRKLIREWQQNVENQAQEFPLGILPPVVPETGVNIRQRMPSGRSQIERSPRGTPTRFSTPRSGMVMAPYGQMLMSPDPFQQQQPQHMQYYMGQPLAPPMFHQALHHPGGASLSSQARASPRIRVQGGLPTQPLSELSVDDMCSLLSRLEGLSLAMKEKYAANLRAHNISGVVLMHCDLRELKPEMQMTFGDWEIFRALVQSMRDKENEGNASFSHEEQPASPPVKQFTQSVPLNNCNVEVPEAQYASDPSTKLKKDSDVSLPADVGSEPKPRDSSDGMESESPLVGPRDHQMFEEAMLESAALREFIEATGVNEESHISEDELDVIEEEDKLEASPPSVSRPLSEETAARRESTKQKMKEMDYERPKLKDEWASDSDSEEMQQLCEKTAKMPPHSTARIPKIKLAEENASNHTLNLELDTSPLKNESEEDSNPRPKQHLHTNDIKGLFQKVKSTLSRENVQHEFESLLNSDTSKPEQHASSVSSCPESTTSSRPISLVGPSNSHYSSQSSLEGVHISPTSSCEHLALRKLTLCEDKDGPSAFTSVSPQSSAPSSRPSSRAQSANYVSHGNSSDPVHLHISEGEDGGLVLISSASSHKMSSASSLSADEESFLLNGTDGPPLA